MSRRRLVRALRCHAPELLKLSGGEIERMLHSSNLVLYTKKWIRVEMKQVHKPDACMQGICVMGEQYWKLAVIEEAPSEGVGMWAEELAAVRLTHGNELPEALEILLEAKK